ncbi:MAG: hypothetical protein DLM72_07815 [Candidatus Nitrosopolaris wilkensis]|nr:MAG: hypothetical protein DLM72_07815 [Candidatus Nitrosopolaris wilkensis]
MKRIPRIASLYKKLKPNRLLIFVSVIIFVLGLAPGFSIAQVQKERSTYSVIITVINVFLAASGMLTLFRQWIKETRAEEKKPKLEFGELSKQPEYYYYGKDLTEYVYFINVRIIGEGTAERCRAYIDVEGTYFTNQITVWNRNDKLEIDIDRYETLRLFRVSGSNIVFKLNSTVTNKSTNNTNETARRYKEICDKQMKINIKSSNTKLPEKPFEMKVEDIIQKA